MGVNYITGEAFKPTTANQVEVGIKYNSPDKATKATLSAYDITRKNDKVTAIDWTKQTQTGETTSKGFEISADHRFNDWLNVGVGYGYVDAEKSPRMSLIPSSSAIPRNKLPNTTPHCGQV